MNPNYKNSVDLSFDLDSILSEFGALDEEPVSEKPVFEPAEPIKDAAKALDEVFSAVINDGVKAETAQDEYDFDPEEIAAEFESEDSISESTSKLDAQAVRREFYSEDSIRPAAPAKEAETSTFPAETAVADDVLDEVDRIIAEFRHEDAPAGRVIEPEPAPVEEPEPTKLREEHLSSPSEPSEPKSESEQTRVRFDEPSENEPEPDLYEGSGIEENPEDKYAADADYTVMEPEIPKKEKARREPKSFRESVAVPVITALAFIAMKIKQSQVTLGETSYEAEDLGEEMPPDKAAKFYDKHIAGLRLRARIAFVLCAVMMYISYGLPVPGALFDAGVKSAVCLIMMIAVMICGLDIITTGIMSIVKLKLHASALIVVSCLLCMIDAFLSAANVGEKVVPFCVIPSLTIAFTLLGCIMNARSNRVIFNTAAAAKRPYVLTAESELSGGDITLVKGSRPVDGMVRRTEEDGPDESAFGLMAPYLIVGALLLSLISAVIGKSFSGFAHILSGIFVCAAPIAMLITFPLPFFVSVKSLIKNGSAIAGWSGLYDVGKARHLIITDADLFPRGCVKVVKTRILSGMKPEKVISFAASIISASGSALVPAFSELMHKGNGSLLKVEAFTVHESGGLIAMVDGEEVFCGNAGFMRLMGMHLPEKFVVKDCVYVAASGSICGVFEIEYTATKAVRRSLEALMSSSRHPIFAIRDFNITPQMLSIKFDMATDGFDFPAYSERYEISGAAPSAGSKPAALISREGLEPLISLADHGRLLYGRIRLNVMLSVLSTVIGVVLMFILSLSGTLSVVTALTYLLGWLLLAIILSFAINTP